MGREQLAGLRRGADLLQGGVGQVCFQPQGVGAAAGGDDGPAGLVGVSQGDLGPGVHQVADRQFRVRGGEVHGRGPGRFRAEQGDVPFVGAGPVGQRPRRWVRDQVQRHGQAGGQLGGQGRGHPVRSAVRGPGADQHPVPLVDPGPQRAVRGQIVPGFFAHLPYLCAGPGHR
ncbi:MAG TPA: hypothetical protein VHW06_04335 [Streptosporangiaceae bacterium]|nr:hypothetical protein [Streptosporangiaceae bacterium]